MADIGKRLGQQESEWAEEERRAQKKADRERKRIEAREAAEKKKRFALTPEKKRKLRVRIFTFTLPSSLGSVSSAVDHENGDRESEECC